MEQVVEIPEEAIVELSPEEAQANIETAQALAKEQARQAKMTKQFPKISEELGNLRGFKDLMAERTGYYLGRQAKMAEMNKATKTERKTASGIRTTIRESIPKWIAETNVTEYEKQTGLLADASKVVSEKSKPFRTQIKPLTRAVKYIDNIAVPAVLEQLGVTLQATFTLSDFIKAKLEEQKNN